MFGTDVRNNNDSIVRYLISNAITLRALHDFDFDYITWNTFVVIVVPLKFLF